MNRVAEKLKLNNLSIKTFFLLWAFWVILAGRLEWQSASVGALVAFGVTLLNLDLALKRGEAMPFGLGKLLGWVRYAGRLLVEVLRANWQVAMILLRRKVDISPCLVRYKTGLKTDLAKVILATSITLTPGTLTVEVEGDRFLVHTLTEEGAREVARWVLEEKLVEMEREV
ncbi:MAG: Na+/H+ antiporter subunit E [Bacillota bacterium]